MPNFIKKSLLRIPAPNFYPMMTLNPNCLVFISKPFCKTRAFYQRGFYVRNFVISWSDRIIYWIRCSPFRNQICLYWSSSHDFFMREIEEIQEFSAKKLKLSSGQPLKPRFRKPCRFYNCITRQKVSPFWQARRLFFWDMIEGVSPNPPHSNLTIDGALVFYPLPENLQFHINHQITSLVFILSPSSLEKVRLPPCGHKNP